MPRPSSAKSRPLPSASVVIRCNGAASFSIGSLVAAWRVRSAACITRARRCVQGVRWLRGLPLVPPLPSVDPGGAAPFTTGAQSDERLEPGRCRSHSAPAPLLGWSSECVYIRTFMPTYPNNLNRNYAKMRVGLKNAPGITSLYAIDCVDARATVRSSCKLSLAPRAAGEGPPSPAPAVCDDAHCVSPISGRKGVRFWRLPDDSFPRRNPGRACLSGGRRTRPCAARIEVATAQPLRLRCTSTRRFRNQARRRRSEPSFPRRERGARSP